MSPYKLLYKQIPSYSHLKVFNCICFASTVAHNMSKSDPKAKQCVFLGYPFAVKVTSYLISPLILALSLGIIVYMSCQGVINFLILWNKKKITKNAEIRNKY